jgi:hypothetical protein
VRLIIPEWRRCHKCQTVSKDTSDQRELAHKVSDQETDTPHTWQPNKPSLNLSDAELAQLPAII